MPARGARRGERVVRDPVCGMDLGPAEQAEALGAFVVERRGQRHYLCSSTCRDEFQRGA